MKQKIIWLALILAAVCDGAAGEWGTDVHAAMDRAAQEKKLVLLDFTGSDWCGWCIRFKNEVFDQPDFAPFAQANLELVEVDFPRSKPQSAEQTEANHALGRTYGVNGYPTLVVIDSMGKELWRQTGYRAGGPKSFIAEMEKLPGIRHTDPTAGKPDVTPTAHVEPKFVPIPPATPTHYGELKLKGISGVKDRRLALINNATLSVGESAKVKVQDGKLDVTCDEIRDNSVLITVDGKQRELKLTEH